MRQILLIGPRNLRLRARVAETRGERARGLIGRRSLADDEALLFLRTKSVHTFGMRFPITVVLLDDDLVARHVVPVRPGRLVMPRLRGRHVLECASTADVRPGDSLVVRRSRPARSYP